jgi:leucyl/phenylalanyl-tRNA--protein transferase
MPVTKFPDLSVLAHPDFASGPEGLIGLGGDLEPETLLTAYRRGIFPWPMENFPLAWFCPDERAILDFSRIHIPRRLARIQRQIQQKQIPLELRINRAFEEVIRNCADIPRQGQAGTWITPEMTDAYLQLHQLGYALSAETWEDGQLVGGIYGVWIDGAFSGESMFHLRPNASKLALLHLVEHLKTHGLSWGLNWMDIQVMTPHMEKLGAHTLSRAEFLKKLAQTHSRFHRCPGKPQ